MITPGHYNNNQEQDQSFAVQIESQSIEKYLLLQKLWQVVDK